MREKTLLWISNKMFLSKQSKKRPHKLLKKRSRTLVLIKNTILTITWILIGPTSKTSKNLKRRLEKTSLCRYRKRLMIFQTTNLNMFGSKSVGISFTGYILCLILHPSLQTFLKKHLDQISGTITHQLSRRQSTCP